MPFLKISSEAYLSVGGVVAGTAVLLAIPAGSAVWMCIALCVCGLFFGAMIPCILTMVSAHVPDNPMLVTTLLMLAFYLGQSIGPTMTGALESSYNLHAGIGGCAVFIILASIFCKYADSGCRTR